MPLLLTLIRHAKSSWADPGQDDFDRPLNERGNRDAPEMGRRLRQAGWRPDRMLASPATRAAATAKAIAVAVDYPERDIVWKPDLYLASPRAMLRELVAAADGVGHVALVAHNPGTTELAERLSGEALGNVPTCGVVRLRFDVDAWPAVGDGLGKLIDFDYPKRERRD